MKVVLSNRKPRKRHGAAFTSHPDGGQEQKRAAVHALLRSHACSGGPGSWLLDAEAALVLRCSRPGPSQSQIWLETQRPVPQNYLFDMPEGCMLGAIFDSLMQSQLLMERCTVFRRRMACTLEGFNHAQGS